MLQTKPDGHPYPDGAPGVSRIAVCVPRNPERSPSVATARPSVDQRWPQAVVDVMFHDIIAHNWPDEATANRPRPVRNRVGALDREPRGPAESASSRPGEHGAPPGTLPPRERSPPRRSHLPSKQASQIKSGELRPR